MHQRRPENLCDGNCALAIKYPEESDSGYETWQKVEAALVFAALSLTPLVLWAALGIARGVYGANLHAWLPRLRLLRWIFYIIGVAALFVSVVSDTHWLFSIGMGLSCLSMGLALPEGWLKRHYAPELLQAERESPDGWWPSPRD